MVLRSVALLLALATFIARAQVLVPGEELIYRVSYIGIELGTIRLVNEGRQEALGKPAVKCKAFIDSRPGIPFLSLHVVYESWMEPTALASLQFVAQNKESGEYTKYTFDYDQRRISTATWMDRQKTDERTFNITRKYVDGLTILYAARQLLYSKRTAWIPTIVREDTAWTKINFTGKVVPTTIDAVSYPVRTVYFDGEANWTGVYGVTGYFEGWFSDDDARIPIKAKMKLYLGSADIELISWKRPGWSPPPAKE
ncbi:MAG: hypothetical protein KatS3mg040_1727 [Candidatus Kapaibacterium sp.]|nr:MAG: hypothetical protein KatS3mg040_1727 [Candidatus Kapabacteria bacterium]